MIERNFDLVFLLLSWGPSVFCALSTTDGVRGSGPAPGSKIACDVVLLYNAIFVPMYYFEG